MPRKPPAYLSHSSGQARVKIKGKVYYLGKYGSEDSHAEYERLVNGWRKNLEPGSSVRVAEVVDWWLQAAEARYGGRRGSEFHHHAYAVQGIHAYLKSQGQLELLARDFGPKQLLGVQAELAARWSRRVANRHLVRIRTMWRHAEVEGLVPAGSWMNLRTVPGLAGGTPTVPPVPETILARTLKHVGAVIRAIAETQLWTGARPTEVLGLRPADFIRDGKIELHRGLWLPLKGVWAVDLAQHKMAHRGQRRILLFGPKAQRVVKPFLDRPADWFLFSPEEAYIQWFVSRGRKVNLDHTRRPRKRYDVDSYRRALHAAADRAGVEHWGPYRLRHNAATRLTSEFGPDVARIILGHRDLQTTRGYVVDDLKKAIGVIAKAG